MDTSGRKNNSDANSKLTYFCKSLSIASLIFTIIINFNPKSKAEKVENENEKI
jgi:hypothetical protein